MEDLVKSLASNLYKKFLNKWFSPTEDEWLKSLTEAIQNNQSISFRNYAWGLLWVCPNTIERSGYFMWKPFLGVMALIWFLLAISR